MEDGRKAFDAQVKQMQQKLDDLAKSAAPETGEPKPLPQEDAEKIRRQMEECQKAFDAWMKGIQRQLDELQKSQAPASANATPAPEKVPAEAATKAGAPLVPVAAGPAAPVEPASPAGATELPEVTVYGRLDVARSLIVPDLGATAYSVTKDQIEVEPRGENAPFNQVLLRAPGVAEDSLGGLHVRGEHANLQYRINDVLLPEGVTGFGLELDPRFMSSMEFITGSLPAQYGFRTAGIVDIQTKSGVFNPGGEVGIYGGSFNTLRPSFEYGGSDGKLNYFFDGSYEHNGIGVENPTGRPTAIHDDTDQEKAFMYWSYILDSTSRLSVMGSLSNSTFQVPNTPNLPAGTSPNGNPWLPGMFNSSHLNENQLEQNDYGVIAYQKSVDDLNFQIAGFGRYSAVHFIPDTTGDLFFNGVASDVNRMLGSGGLQADASYRLNDEHTLRGGLMSLYESLESDTTTNAFPVDAAGNPTGSAFPIVDNSGQRAFFNGVYLQDEWKVLPKLTLNYGARFDMFSSTFDNENQLSPRVNVIYKPADSTTLHAGYARYFTPPPLENVPAESVAKFNGTSNASAVTRDDPVQAERSNYFDAGITQKILPGLQVGVDGYYKIAKDQLDDGLFGASLIPSAFNYEQGRVRGLEFTGSYVEDPWSVYANVAVSKAEGTEINSAQFLFSQDDLNYIQSHWIHLDHDQTVTGSFGCSYTWKETFGKTRTCADLLYGTGLRENSTTSTGQVIPNGGHVPDYWTLNLGAEQSIKVGTKGTVKARLDLVNLTDNVYELRNGTGVGVNAPQYGMRRGIFASLSYAF